MSLLSKGGGDLKPLVKWGEKNPILSNTIDFRVNACRNGDCAEVIRTKMFLEYPAPVFDGERFLPEDFLWINSAFKYDTVYISKIIYLCEYREDGLTKTKNLNRFKNPLGGMYTCNLYFNSQISVYVQLKKAILYDCYALYTGKLIANLKKSKGVIVCILSLPISFFCLNTGFGEMIDDYLYIGCGFLIAWWDWENSQNNLSDWLFRAILFDSL